MVLTALLMLLVYQSVTEGFNIVLQANVGRCLHVGDTLELHCSISNWEETHGPDLNQLQIIHKNGGKVNTSVVDNRTVLGTVSNVKAVGKLIFECRNKSDFNEYNYLSFEVTEPDPMPEDIMCIANGAVNKVVCSWESRDRCTTWRLFYSVNGEPETECELPVQNISKHCASGSINSNLKLRNSCHKEEPLQLECILKISNVHQTFRLERKSSFGLRRETEIKKIFNDSIVKLDPIENLQVQRTSHSISLGWKFLYRPLYYENGIYCVVTCGEETKQLTFTNNVRSYEVTRILFRELHPFTEYNITVTCKVSGSPYWGDAVQRSFITDEDVPLTGPHTTHHSYLLAKCKSYNADSCLTIHTKIDLLEARGIICGFKVEMRGSHRSDLKQEFEFTNESTTLEIGPLKRGITPPYHVSIWSKTSKGLSINSTDILIYPREGNDIIDEVIVEEEDTHYLVTSQLSPDSDPSQHIFHWCYGIKNGAETVTCKGGYEYRNSSKPEFRLQKTEMNRSYSIEEDPSNGQWHFGFSVNTDKGTSGLHWEDCRFGSSRNVPNLRQPERPSLSDSSHCDIVVEVQSFCSSETMASQRLRPINYTVVYANTNDPGDERTKTFQARYNDNGLELNGLTPGLIYSVKYNVGYRHKTSPYSELAFKYINTQPKVEMIVGLGIGTTILLLAGILLIRKCVVWYKEIDQPIDGVEIDNNNEDHLNPKPEVRCDDSSIVSHHSDDGKYSTIPGSKNGYASVVGKSKFQNKLYKCDKLASCNGLDDFNISFQIISSEGFGNFVSANDVRKDVEQNPDVTAARYSRAGTIDEHGQSQLESDVALNTISNEERSVEGVPRLTDSMSMIGCSHMSNSDVTLDSYELSVILFGTEGEEETDGIDDLYQREVEIPPKSVQCTDNDSSSKFTDVVDEAALPGTNHQPLSGYKKIPSEEVASVIIQAENHESPAILETENFCLTVGTDIEGHVPEVEPTQISTLDTQFSGSLFHQDGCPVVSPLPTHAVDPSDRCVGSPKAFKNHYKTLPSPNKTLDS